MKTIPRRPPEIKGRAILGSRLTTRRMTIQVELNAEMKRNSSRVQGIPLEKVAERLLQEA